MHTETFPKISPHTNAILLLTLVKLISGEKNGPVQLNDFNGLTDHNGQQSKIFRILEESPNGTVVPGVAEHLQQFGRLSFSGLTFDSAANNFQLLNTRDQLAIALHLHPTSGELRVTGRIDRETLCPLSLISKLLEQNGNIPARYKQDQRPSDDCIKPLEILVTSRSDQSQSDVRKILIKLYIEDVNDNSPEWSSAHASDTLYKHDKERSESKLHVIEVRLLESVKGSNGYVGSSARVSLPLAHDPDAGLNGLVNYRIEPTVKGTEFSKEAFVEPGLIPFSLERTLDGLLELVATDNLDYERQSSYQLLLLAYDSGIPSRTATALVRVNLIDVNDEAPIFSKSIFYPPLGAISEKTAPGTVILNLSASDADASPVNSRLRFLMVSNPIASQYFTVHSDGRISLRQWLDYESMEVSNNDPVVDVESYRTLETKKRFVFHVQAIDSAPPPYEKKGQALVVIPVKDVNDEPSVITAKFFGPSEVTNNGRLGAVSETSVPPVRMAYIQVKDPDFDGRDRASCQVSDTTNFSLHAVHPTAPGYHPIDTLSEEESQTDYLLSLLVQVDREQTPLLNVLIKCVDDAGNTNEQMLRIRVIDANDEEPKFTQSVYHFQLPENSEPDIPLTLEKKSASVMRYGHRIGRVTAHDKDLGGNGRVAYGMDPTSLEIVPASPLFSSLSVCRNEQQSFIYAGGTQRKPELDDLFRMDETTGVLYALKSFDAENIDFFRLTVLAIDQPTAQGVSSLTGKATVEIKITDMNDCQPVFYRVNDAATKEIGPNRLHGMEQREVVSQYVFHVKENRPTYWLVGRVAALDPDISNQRPTNSAILLNESFQLIQPNVKLKLSPGSDVEVRKTFSLHTTSGYLRTLVPLDREKKAVYVFTVLAIDGLDETTALERSATATVTVFVEDENDNDPVFIRPVASIEKPSASATLNSKPNHPDWKDIGNTEAGKVSSTMATFNATHKDERKLSDQSIPIVLVHKKAWTQQMTKDGEFIGGAVPLLQLEATDADIGENAQLTYRIGSGNTDGLFALDNVTGTLLFSPASRRSKEGTSASKTGPDRATVEGKHINYLLRFEACDNGVPKRCAVPIWVRMVLDMKDLTSMVSLEHLTGEITNDNYLTSPSGGSGTGVHYQDVPLRGQPNDREGYINWKPNMVSHGNAHEWYPYKNAENPLSSSYGTRRKSWNMQPGFSWESNSHNPQMNDRSLIHVDGHSFRQIPPSSSLVVSEAVIICLIVIFIVLMSAAAILFCLKEVRDFFCANGPSVFPNKFVQRL